MKLRSITLSDVRQFTSPVRVADIRDGLNVLSAPNEAGKSTLFDAIHALFFVPHRSTRIAPLRPDVGGNPQITIEVDLDGTLHRLTKTWGRGKTAEVWRDARLIAKGDEAEAFISDLTLPADEGGPAGLLWVRQGLTALDEGSKSEIKLAQQAARDLMSSVTGEFEALTGGKRMDKALSKAQADLDALITQRGAKAGGAYDLALKTVTRLEETCATLQERATLLQEALDTRRKHRRALRDFTDPAEIATRTARLDAARRAFDNATRHADAMRVVQAEMQRAQAAQTDATQQLARHEKTAQAVERLKAELAAAQVETQTMQTEVAARRTALEAARARATAARAARQNADTQLQAALRAAARQSQLARLKALTQACDEATDLIARLPDLRRAAQTGPDARMVQSVDAAEQDLRLAQHLAAAAAPHVSVHYAIPDAPQVTQAGAPCRDGEAIPVHTPAVFDLPGIGQITVAPGQGHDAPNRLEKAQEALDRLVEKSGVTSAGDARAALRARQAAETSLQAAQTQLARLAPDGIDAMKAEIETLKSDIPETSDVDPDLAQKTLNEATQEYDKSNIDLESARTHCDSAEQNLLRATFTSDNISKRLGEARQALNELPDIQILKSTAAEMQHALSDAQSRLAKLTQNAPDLDTARIARDRAEDIVRNAEAETAKLNIAIARLDATIETQAGDGIEEDFAEAQDQLTRARETVAVFETEIAVLKCLIAALQDAQSAARDRYFAPVLEELRPMLRLLWPGAALQFDGDSLLPSALVRDGQEEPIGTLSGGTREQIALLVRLAFARLLAKQGNHAPVILDDALVYSDDDRIEQMFNALHGQSADLQILVFSCRTRALRALGGNMLSIDHITPTP